MGVTPPGARVLALDAGNSKTDAVVVGADGTVLGSGRSGGFQPPRTGVEPAVDVLAQAVREAVKEAAEAGEPADGPVAHVTACLANVDLPREEREVGAAVRGRGWGAGVDVLNDTFALLRAGLPDDGTVRHGVAVVCGAGVNCVGRAEDGRTHRFPAVGKLSGDWGGGGGLSEEALWHAARADDGRGQPTALARELPAHFGLPGMPELIEALHLGDLPAVRRHEITPLLFAVAAGGDAVARALVERQADEIAAFVLVTLERLGLTGQRTPVVLGGGVLAARHPQLEARLEERLARRAPKAETSVVTARPVVGAALLGLDRLGASPAACARLRSALG